MIFTKWIFTFSIEPRLEVAMPQYQQHGTKNAADQQTNQGPNHSQHRETFWEWTTKDAAGFYTLFLAAVTAILAIVAGVQAVMFFWQLKLMREGISEATRLCRFADPDWDYED
jgi:hypothetical protein